MVQGSGDLHAEGLNYLKFWWKGDVDGRELELVVRVYVNARRQMAVCAFLHTKDDIITANFRK